MEELINLVTKQTGIPADKARIAVDLTLNFIKQRLPEPIAAQLDILIGSDDPAKAIDGLASALGALLENSN